MLFWFWTEIVVLHLISILIAVRDFTHQCVWVVLYNAVHSYWRGTAFDSCTCAWRHTTVVRCTCWSLVNEELTMSRQFITLLLTDTDKMQTVNYLTGWCTPHSALTRNLKMRWAIYGSCIRNLTSNSTCERCTVNTISLYTQWTIKTWHFIFDYNFG